MMVRIEEDFVRNALRVHVIRGGEGNTQVLQQAAGNPYGRWEHVDDRTDARDIAPYLTVPADIFALIVAAGSETMPPDRAQGRHLDDAIAVRDRLLALAEQAAAR